MRIDKYLSDMGIGTRGEIKKALRKKRLLVNGEVIKDAGYRVEEGDIVRFDDEEIEYREFEYFMLNKPDGVVSAREDRRYETVLDLIMERKRKDLFPVGRLDIDTEGLVLITNNGELSHDMLSPKNHVEKVYYLECLGKLGDAEIEKCKKGFKYDEDLVSLPSKLEVIESSDISRANIHIHEGKFHQIKKMFEVMGKEIIYLKRTSMGPLKLDEDLEPGEYRRLNEDEISMLLGMDKKD